MWHDPQEEDYNLFLDLVGKMLTYDPAERILPEDVLRHPFLHRDSLQTEAQSAATLGNAARQPGHPPPPPTEAWAPPAPTSSTPERAMQGDDGTCTTTMEVADDQPASRSTLQEPPHTSTSILGGDGSHDAAQLARSTRAAKLQQKERNGKPTSD